MKRDRTGKERPIRIGIYADVDTNLIDGSSIWLQSLVEMLHHGERTEIALLPKANEKRDVITRRLRELARVEIVDPSNWGFGQRALRPTDVGGILERLDQREPFDAILIRGREVAKRVSEMGAFAGRLWVYYLPPSNGRLGPDDVEYLEQLADSCKYVLCQTEHIRALIEAAVPQLSRRLLLLPPMIPDYGATDQPSPDGTTRMVYVGKFSRSYRFLEIVQLFRSLRDEVSGLELHVAGDKIHNPTRDPDFELEVEEALTTTQGLVWHRGISRQEVQELLQSSDVALSLRDPELDRSLELSTKVLEYGANSLPVVLNRGPLYEDLLGTDYPLFLDTPQQAADVVRKVLTDDDLRNQAAAICARASEDFTLTRTWDRVQPFVERIAPLTSHPWVPGRPTRVLVAGHDMKFFNPIAEYLQLAGAEIREDLWSGHNRHDEQRSLELLDWADVIICEWCLGNAVWYSRHKKEHQAMLVRLHRVEMEREYPGLLAIENIDRVIFVSPHLLRAAIRQLGWPEEKLTVIANSVEVDTLERKKLPGYEFNLGLLGYVPRRKRLDLALDILELLRVRDSRFRLCMKGKPPWDLKWVWNKEDERSYHLDQFRRIERSPNLRGAVSFEPFGEDVMSWFQKVGFLLSTSDSEGNQVAVAEGMAAGSVPVVLDRPGALDVYPSEYVHVSASSAAAAIWETLKAGNVEHEHDRVRHLARVDFSPRGVTKLWEDAISQALYDRAERQTSRRESRLNRT